MKPSLLLRRRLSAVCPTLAQPTNPSAKSLSYSITQWFYQTPTTDLLRFGPALQFERAEHYLLTYQRMAHERTLRAEIYQKNYTQLATFDPARPGPSTRPPTRTPAAATPGASTCCGATAPPSPKPTTG